METMKIEPSNKSGVHCTGKLSDITVADITSIIGFGPNYEDDPDKVENSWRFTVDGVLCAIWDYKQSHIMFNEFSTFGPSEILQKLFGAKYRKFSPINEMIRMSEELGLYDIEEFPLISTRLNKDINEI